MIEFDLSPKMDELIRRVRATLDELVIPLERKLVGRPFADAEPELFEARDRVRAAGLFAPQVPTEWGGLGLGFREHALVSEVLGRSPIGHFAFNCQAPD